MLSMQKGLGNWLQDRAEKAQWPGNQHFMYSIVGSKIGIMQLKIGNAHL